MRVNVEATCVDRHIDKREGGRVVEWYREYIIHKGWYFVQVKIPRPARQKKKRRGRGPFRKGEDINSGRMGDGNDRVFENPI